MTREELIRYIRENDSFYKTVDLEKRSLSDLRKLKDLVEAIVEGDALQKKRKK